MKKYGVPLTTDNGRDPLLDAWEEAADLLFYLTQALMERNPSAHPQEEDDPGEARYQSRCLQEASRESQAEAVLG